MLHAAAGRVLPQDCALCGGSSHSDLLCTPCNRSLEALPLAHCPRCAMPSAPGQECGRCLKRMPHYDRTHAALRYQYPADRVILALKYRAKLPVAAYLARRLADSLRPGMRHHAAIDVVIPMPLHHARLAMRGYNQSVEIGRRVARELALPFACRTALCLRDTPPQANLPLKQRRANVRGAFSCSPALAGMSIAVVDDVMTSGATLDELAGVLKRAGAVRVENWVVARTWPREPRD